MKEQPNYYAIIPASVRYDKELRANEKLLYGEITALANATGECWASNNYFAELYQVTPQAISRWINHLKEQGYINIKIIYKNNSKEIDKRIISMVSTNDCGGINKKLIGYQQKVKGNNTSINNTSINNNIYTQVVDHLNLVCGTDYKATTKSTQKLIHARYNEGFTLEDFYIVIDKKASQWKGTEFEKYLRPQTLFSTKFESYLNEKIRSGNTFTELLKEMQTNDIRTNC